MFTPTYTSWAGMKKRCDNPNDPKYPNYGGRGIAYAPEWASFDAFLADMGERPARTSLDRIDNEGGYSKQNCRWATHMQQVMNRRCTRRVQYGGKEWRMRELAEHLGLTRECLRKRIDAGWSEDHLSVLPQKSRHWRKARTA